MFDEKTLSELEAVKARYPEPRAAVLPVAHAVQRQRGWIDEDGRRWIAEFLGIDPMYVHEVVTFYPMLFDRPVGEHVIHVCRTLSCDACGGRQLWEHLERRLGVSRGETTADGRFTLRTAECLASCGTAPAMLIDGERHENVTPGRVDELLEGVS